MCGREEEGTDGDVFELVVKGRERKGTEDEMEGEGGIKNRNDDEI